MLLASSRLLSHLAYRQLRFSSATTNDDFADYARRQSELTDKQRAPVGGERFEHLQSPNIAFRDFTPFFKCMRLHDPYSASTTMLLRGRRWGKSTFGQAWLAYLRQEAHLFKGTAVEQHMRSQPLIGIAFDVSRCKSLAHFVHQLGCQAEDGMSQANLLSSWTNPLPSLSDLEELSVDRLKARTSELFGSLGRVTRSSKLKFALFVDEYDYLATRALRNEPGTTADYPTTNAFFADFYRSLKAKTEVIPFQFITGSSRLAIKSFWSGANNIRDMSFEPQMATVLGYTWEQIEKYFAIQLTWLEQLHGMTRDQLRCHMEEWYYHHRWSPRSKQHVFNPWSVHKFIRTGRFEAHWSRTGAPTRLINSRSLVKSVVQSVTSADKHIFVEKQNLIDVPLPTAAGEALSDEAQKALLVGAGVLTIHPDSVRSDLIRLTVPNRDAAVALVEVFKSALTIPQSFTSMVMEPLFLNNDWAGLIDAMNSTGAFKAALDQLTNKSQCVSEEVITLALTCLIAMRRPSVLLRSCYPVVSNKSRTVFHVDSTKTTNILEIKMQSSRQRDDVMSEQLLNALKQCLLYKDLAKKDYQVLYTVVIFAKPAAESNESALAVEVVTKPLTEQQITELVSAIERSDEGKEGKAKESSRQAVLLKYIAMLNGTPVEERQ